MKSRRVYYIAFIVALLFTLPVCPTQAANPIISDIFTADPAALVHGDTVYLYAGQDEAAPNTHYRMNRWLCYSSTDMKTWKSHGSALSVADFKWAVRDAYAAHVVEKDGKFYWYVSIEHDRTKPGKAIGVAVADSPTGPFKDARGSALVTADMTTRGRHGWEDIDPAVFIDKDGTAYLFWGNSNCYYAKLKPNMIELDGDIQPVGLPFFTEAPWIHQRDGLYYLSYATGFPEKIAYATAPSITGPWTYRGLLAEVAGNSNTIHQSIIEFKGQWYFVYHNAALPGGDSYRRSVCVDYLYYNTDGSMRRVVQTTEGTDLSPSPPTNPDLTPLPQWSRIQSFGEANLFVRHANHKGVVSLEPFDPYADAMWKLLPGLSDPKGVSFESLNLPGWFMLCRGNDVVLAKQEDSTEFRSAATFFQVEGLADAKGSSFRAAGSQDRFLSISGTELQVRTVAAPDDRTNATFNVLQEGGALKRK